MTAISTVYDGLVSALDSLYSTTHTKIDNPYDIQDNDDLLLRRGYGFAFNQGGLNSNRLMSNVATISRDISVILTIKWRGTAKDITLRQAAEKQLLEDQFLMIDYFTGNAGMGISQVWKIVYNGDNGIESIGDRTDFIQIVSNFSLEYSEEC